MSQMVHGSAVSVNGCGVLLLGASGSGKSDLALRMIDRGATLISDDIVYLENVDSATSLVFAPSIAGKIEIRGVGICRVDYVETAPLRLVVQFAEDIERLPSADMRTSICNISVPVIQLEPFHASSILKIEFALGRVVEAGLFPIARTIVEAEEGIML